MPSHPLPIILHHVLQVTSDLDCCLSQGSLHRDKVTPVIQSGDWEACLTALVCPNMGLVKSPWMRPVGWMTASI